MLLEDPLQWDTVFLYVPTSYNYEAVDSILATRKKPIARQTRSIINGKAKATDSESRAALILQAISTEATILGIQIMIAQCPLMKADSKST